MCDNIRFEKNPGFFANLFRFVLKNPKWWLVPIVIGLLLIGGLPVLGGTSAAPFIYSLF